MNSTYIVALIVLFTAYVCLLMTISIKRSKKALTKTALLGRVPSNKVESANVESKAKLELDVEISKDDGTGLYRAVTTVKNPSPGERYSFAFYLVVDRKQVDVRWHERSPTFEFMLPDTGNKKEIVAFVKDENGNVFSEKKEVGMLSNKKN